MKVADLIGAQLDYWVARAERVKVAIPPIWKDCDEPAYARVEHIKTFPWGPPAYEPSKDWAIGGPILEDNVVGVIAISDAEWLACEQCTHFQARGPSYLVAGMRARVMCAFGEEVPEQ